MMNLTVKQKEIVDKFKELQEKYNNKVVINASTGKAYFWRLSEDGKTLITADKQPINYRIINSLDSKGCIKPVNMEFEHITEDQVQQSKYDTSIGFIGAVIDF